MDSEKDILKNNKLELWQIIAFYMAKANNKGFQVKTLVDELYKEIIYR